MKAAALIVALALAGCATPIVAVRPAQKPACFRLGVFTPAQEQDAFAALQAHPNANLAAIVQDWVRTRDDDRACLGAKP